MRISVGIPAYKATQTICDCLSSIQIQSIRDEVDVIIASDNPEDNYEFVKEKFPYINITILPCEENTGAGLARQRALDACKTDWITFIDADDVFFTPLALEQLRNGIQPNVIEVQGTFLQEIVDNPQVRVVPMSDIQNPWVFARLYNTKFLKQNDIQFDELRAINKSVA